MAATQPDHGNWQKYQSSNPLQRRLLGRFRTAVVQTALQGAPARVLDIGCAEGFILNDLRAGLPGAELIGIDQDQEALARGRRLHAGLDLRTGNTYALPFPDASFDLVLCLETLEHLDQPAAALAEIARVSRGPAILSVPFEPWFRFANLVRGKHVRAWGNDPEHIQHWGRRSFSRLVSSHLSLERLSILFPWLFVLAHRH